MKRVKRLFACLLALTMMLGLSATAFAAETVGKVQKPADGRPVTFEKEYKLIGAGTSPAETFEFNIVDAGVENGGVDAEKRGMPTVGTAAYDANGATTTGAKEAVTVTLPTYKSVGVYSYTITEKPGTTAGVAYDGKPVTMKVTVVNNDNGGFEIAAVSFTKDGKKLADGEAAFNNTYTANNLSIKKIVAGNLGDKSRDFNFKVEFEKTGEDYTKTSCTVKGGSGKYAAGKTFNSLPNSIDISLKHDETITIENLPQDVKYTVTETSADGYTTTVGEKTTNIAEGTMDEKAKTVVFTNTKTGKIDTGVYLDNLPYILVFAGVLAIAAVFVVRRRRFED